ncbi:hypothetical protein [Janthinobacterium psychrotolerans]|uniref:Uncharacterized protein n=1 Tax=Janthinobacterium psychrotolerans TaxID=1747903 RepID=A0A1A7C542_9BURK|nr:hypothetical protein [Janthinobacterium psychrotolerans]OBV40154.1 hypothetical protein ASR47_101469 [Janthinobacterium psychrotolerans]
MTQAWFILTRPDGRNISAPTPTQLAEALDQVYRDAGSGHGADGGTASAMLRFGYDDGLMYQVEVASGGEVTFEEWSDRDCEIALASPRRMTALRQDDALQLWQWLAQRQVAKIRAQTWQSGE